MTEAKADELIALLQELLEGIERIKKIFAQPDDCSASTELRNPETR
jgi:hypothetical protein